MEAIRNSIRKRTDNSWIIGGKLLLVRQDSPSSEPDAVSWSDGDKSFFVLTTSDGSGMGSQILLDGNDGEIIEKVYDAGDVSAVWKAGKAFIKVRETDAPDNTREHVTLEYLQQSKADLDFNIPTTLYHHEFDNRYYLITTALPGETLMSVWPTLSDTMKQHCVDRVAQICEQLAKWEGHAISGVDNGQLSDTLLTKSGDTDFRPDSLAKGCKEYGMTTSRLHFYHCDLGPGNITVDPDGAIGILDWETAGFVPREWICTKFRVSGGLDFNLDNMDERVDWRRRVSKRLLEMGFGDVAGLWYDWWSSGQNEVTCEGDNGAQTSSSGGDGDTSAGGHVEDGNKSIEDGNECAIERDNEAIAECLGGAADGYGNTDSAGGDFASVGENGGDECGTTQACQ